MEELLKQLLNRLEDVGETNSEIYDTECRDQMGDAVADGFLLAAADFVLPNSFGLYSAPANRKVRDALASYIDEANRRAAALGILKFKERLSAFQNGAIKSDRFGCYFDNFFGYMPPDDYDEAGRVV
jgi:hypothetical protein